ncbi:MAG: hypothetical protein HFE76_14100 [Firmicutes bacterium]|nr:hypothetical protein [Bacillota bacterium]
MAKIDLTKQDYRRCIWQRINEIEDITLLAGIWIFVDEIAYREKQDGKPQKEKQED